MPAQSTSHNAPSDSSSAPPINIDQTVSDFDGVTFHISTPESKTKIVVSIQVKCYNELLKYGAQQVLEREYGPYVIAPESGYNFSVQVDLESLPEDKGWKFVKQVHVLILTLIRSTRRPDPESVSVEAERNGCTLRACI